MALAVKVKDRDFIPPSGHNNMYVNDSIQVYFDQLNNNSRGYDGNDLIYQIGLVNGRATAWREQPSSRNEIVERIKTSVKRHNGYTVYEALFPAEEFTCFTPSSGKNIGFSLLVNNRDNLPCGTSIKSAMSPSPSTPYLNPYVWRDLVLAEQPPAKAYVSINGDIPLSPKNLKSGKWRKKNEKDPKTLFYSSDVLKPVWQKYTFSFTPEEDGNARITLFGKWQPENNIFPEIFYREVKIEGAAAPPSLENWKNHNKPEILESKSGVVVKAGRRKQCFTTLSMKRDVPVKVTMWARSVIDQKSPKESPKGYDPFKNCK